jgi:hypothetical protein
MGIPKDIAVGKSCFSLDHTKRIHDEPRETTKLEQQTHKLG